MTEVVMIEPSGQYYPNLIAPIWLEAVEEVIGKNGLKASVNLAGLSYLVGNYATCWGRAPR